MRFSYKIKLIPLVISLFLISSCNCMNTQNISTWVGVYTYVEVGSPSEHIMNYILTIETIEDVINAKLQIDGFQTHVLAAVDLEQAEEIIKVVFNHYLDDSSNLNFQKGDILFSLRYDDENLITEWVQLYPLLSLSTDMSGVYFSRQEKDTGAAWRR